MKDANLKCDNLKDRWTAYRAENPKVRIRNAAEVLGVSEVELVATGLGDTCTRLKPEFAEIVSCLPSLGKVMALTRCDAAVHEVNATFDTVAFQQGSAWFLPPGQDVRYCLERWRYGFAVNENDRLSLQFFDCSGEATHKIYLRKESNVERYNALVNDFQMTPQLDVSGEMLTSQSNETKEGSQSSVIYHLPTSEYTKPLALDSVEKLLHLLVEVEHECMISVMNASVIQSFTGIISRLLRMGPWFNILDPEFNLHLRTDLIDEVWRVTKPTAQGIRHSVVALDESGQEILIVSDNHGDSQQESRKWQKIINKL